MPDTKKSELQVFDETIATTDKNFMVKRNETNIL